MNVLATAPLRHWAGLALHDAPAQQRADIAAMTDDEFWALLGADERTAGDVAQFRRDPQQWSVMQQETGAPAPDSGGLSVYTTHRIQRLYLTLPLVQGRDTGRAAATFADLPSPPMDYVIARTAPADGQR